MTPPGRRAVTTSVTVLSTSAGAAQRAIKVLGDWIPLTVPSEAAHFRHVIPWSLVTTECSDADANADANADADKNAGRVKIHWLAPGPDRGAASSSWSSSWWSPTPPPRHSLLAITQASISTNPCRSNSNDEYDLPAASSVLDPFLTTLSPTRLRASHYFRRPVRASHLLGAYADSASGSSLPVLRVNVPRERSEDEATTRHHDYESHPTFPPTPRNGLKEVVIPYDEEYAPLDAVLPADVRSLLSSPATGLYRLPDSQLCVRPLPTGWHDRHLPPPTLVFHHDTSELESPIASRGESDDDESAVNLRKIGHSGGRGGKRTRTGRFAGQFRLESPDLAGLDIRLCGSTTHHSMFNEAHESLLAGSIERLQSTRVLGVGATRGRDDSTYAANDEMEEERRRRLSDCWMEFRATVRNPMGFFRRHTPGDASRRTAKAPDLPYE